jgi:hypothetical protein
MTKITIGARGSKLSLAYVSRVKDLLIKNNEELNETDIKVKTITTTGDIKHGVRISEIGGKNLFCKEIKENLLKDTPTNTFDSKDMTAPEIAEKLMMIDKAFGLARKRNKKRKGISVFDFDDTLARTNSKLSCIYFLFTTVWHCYTYFAICSSKCIIKIKHANTFSFLISFSCKAKSFINHH